VERRNIVESLAAGLVISYFLILFIGCLLWPGLFWDRFVWRFYWGPIVADAGGNAGSITSSYNWVDTLTYGAVLAVSAYFIHRLFVRLKLRMDLDFFLAMIPVILIGPSARVLEDMELFNEPLRYIFISPLIYIFLGLSTLITILLFFRLEVLYPKGGKWFDRGTFILLLVPGLAAMLLFVGFGDQFNTTFPFWIPALVSLPTAALYTRYRRSTRWEGGVAAFWTEVLVFVISAYLLWMLGGDWNDSYSLSSGSSPDTAFAWGAGIIALALGSTLLLGGVLKLLSGKYPRWKSVVSQINIIIIFGHMLDASATFIGIDHFGYIEKHVVPSGLMGIFGTAAVMYPLKIAFLLPVLYIMDVSMKEESRAEPHLMALLKLTILVLGFAPGTRDLIRLSLGV